jgi:hypothetical protein
MSQVIAGYNVNLPYAIAPVTQTDSTSSTGWKLRGFGARLASQPADPVTTPSDANGIGVGRPASAAEFAAFAPTAGDFAWPWATLQQLGGALTGRVLGVRIITTTQVNSPPAGTKAELVLLQGGGAGGAGASNPGAGSSQVGGSGNSGAWGLGYFTAGFSGALITIGAGGVGGAAGNFAGSPGGGSSFGALVSASGGAAGVVLGPVLTSQGVVNVATGFGGAAVTGANLVASLGHRAVGGFMFGASLASGDGGSTPFGPGGSGAGGNIAGQPPPATSFGGGGSGGCVYNGGAGQPGGAGLSGAALIIDLG